MIYNYLVYILKNSNNFGTKQKKFTGSSIRSSIEKKNRSEIPAVIIQDSPIDFFYHSAISQKQTSHPEGGQPQ